MRTGFRAKGVEISDSTNGLISTGRLDFWFPSGQLSLLVGQAETSGRAILYALNGALLQIFPRASVKGCLLFNDAPIVQDEIGRSLGFVGQNPFAQFSGIKSSVLGEVALPLEMRAVPRSTIELVARFCLSIFSLEHHADANLDWLSGGEAQRLNLAASLAGLDDGLLLEQPMDELDSVFQQHLAIVLDVFAGALDVPIVLLSEDVPPSPLGITPRLDLRPKPKHKNSQIVLEPETEVPRTKKRDQLNPILRVHDFQFRFADTDWLFEPISFTGRIGELIFLLGPNGAGKTSFFRHLVHDTPEGAGSRGEIFVNDTSISKFTTESVINSFSFAFQNPDLYFCRATVHDEIRIGRSANPDVHRNLLAILRLDAHLQKNPYDLPRSLRKRLSIFLAARRLPPILLLDEPSQSHAGPELRHIVDAINFVRNHGTVVLCITHDHRLIDACDGCKKVTFVPKSFEWKEEKMSAGPAFLSWKDNGRDTLRTIWTQIQKSWPRFLPEILTHWKRAVYPTLGEIFRDLSSSDSLQIVDLGCGYGLQTAYCRTLAESHGFKGVTAIGFEWIPETVKTASFFSRGDSRVTFHTADLMDAPEKIEHVLSELPAPGKRFTTCFFVYHDVANAARLTDLIARILAPNEICIVTMVNPFWAMTHPELVKKHESPAPGYTEIDSDFEWLGAAQIEKHDARALWAPFFYRELTSYIEMMDARGLALERLYFTTRSGNVPKLQETMGSIQRNHSERGTARDYETCILLLRRT